ncbi:ArsR/SmtB family transcription factor [Dermatobacter hominis]|uniref:ArsR/SmtB family transcription factor n=1 Tax=Dermatobacter hominis TaxID=2884263 RepID=UPI001D12B802|nr:metalloregulator ArsR/SmtB family transcription factor [Dermatobacter hominis]UDY37559.1 metalloregulator ArsR/SmtB family transcription factor [Dermatobacter hominis]
MSSRGSEVDVAQRQEHVATIGAADCCPSVLAAPLSEDDAERLARRFAALSDPVRLRLLSLIAAADEVCACDLVEPVGRSQPTVSHHTKLLADAGLIVGEKRGRWTWWRIVPEAAGELRDALG